jgi:succinate dehydrogenase / fumarate reductase, cytochrome b subunit
MTVSGVLTIYRTSVGKKVIMALTGIVLVGFVVFHMYGNLKMYQGPVVFNEYAAGLRELGSPVFGHEHLLWVARIGLLASVALHIWAATTLTIQSRKTVAAHAVSGTKRYGEKKRQTGYAAYTMRYGGLLILLFIIYHILHLTFGAVGFGAGQYQHPENGEYQVYNNVVYGFQNPLIVGFYLVTMVFLGLHLFHGVWSMFQTLGLNSAKYTGLLRALAILVAVVVALGNLTFPIAVFTGIVGPAV